MFHRHLFILHEGEREKERKQERDIILLKAKEVLASMICFLPFAEVSVRGSKRRIRRVIS